MYHSMMYMTDTLTLRGKGLLECGTRRSEMKTTKIAVIGAGTIGSAIVKSLVRRGFRDIAATRRQVDRLKELAELGATVSSDNKVAAADADVVIVCVKPSDALEVLEEVREEVAGKLVISVAAALPLQLLKSRAPRCRFIRAMPNMAVLVQESFTAYCVDRDVTAEDRERAKAIFEAMGKHQEVAETYMDAITGLSGSAPAYLAIVVEALMYAGLKVGLPRDLALASSTQSLVGLGKLIQGTGRHPAELKDLVVTPAGVTIEAIHQMESGGLRTAIMNGVEAATKKSRAIVEKVTQENS